MNNKKLNQTEKSILTGMQEALSYAKGKLKVKEHNISLPNVDVHVNSATVRYNFWH